MEKASTEFDAAAQIVDGEGFAQPPRGLFLLSETILYSSKQGCLAECPIVWEINTEGISAAPVTPYKLISMRLGHKAIRARIGQNPQGPSTPTSWIMQ